MGSFAQDLAELEARFQRDLEKLYLRELKRLGAEEGYLVAEGSISEVDAAEFRKPGEAVRLVAAENREAAASAGVLAADTQRRQRRRLGIAGPGFVGVYERPAPPPPPVLTEKDRARVEARNGERFRKTARKVRLAMGSLPARQRPGASAEVAPSWVPIPPGEGRDVEIDGGGLFEELGAEGGW